MIRMKYGVALEVWLKGWGGLWEVPGSHPNGDKNLPI